MTDTNTENADHTAGVLHCETCGRDVDEEDWDGAAEECVRCQDTRRQDDSSHVERERERTAGKAWRAAAERHAEAVNSGRKTPGGTASNQTDNGGFHYEC